MYWFCLKNSFGKEARIIFLEFLGLQSWLLIITGFSLFLRILFFLFLLVFSGSGFSLNTVKCHALIEISHKCRVTLRFLVTSLLINQQGVNFSHTFIWQMVEMGNQLFVKVAKAQFFRLKTWDLLLQKFKVESLHLESHWGYCAVLISLNFNSGSITVEQALFKRWCNLFSDNFGSLKVGLCRANYLINKGIFPR